MLIDAEPDPTAFAAFPREHWTKIRPQQPHRAPWAARSSAEQTSPRVFPDSDSARPLTGSVLPEQRGVAVRRTPPPLPDLPATPDRHAPGRQQHRRHRQSRRPARHHHLTGRTPHQETCPCSRADPPRGPGASRAPAARGAQLRVEGALRTGRTRRTPALPTGRRSPSPGARSRIPGRRPPVCARPRGDEGAVPGHWEADPIIAGRPPAAP